MAVAGKLDLSPLVPFDPISEPSSLSQRWKSWKQALRDLLGYLAAMNITDGMQQKAVLLYQAGQATQEIFDTLPDTGDDYAAAAMAKLDGYFTPKKNVDFEVFQFRKAMQHSGETTDQFATRLRKLASTCEFANVDKEVKSTIIQNCLSKRFRRVALRDDLSLADLLLKARSGSQEASEAQAKGIEQLHPLQDAAQTTFPRYANHNRHNPSIGPNHDLMFVRYAQSGQRTAVLMMSICIRWDRQTLAKPPKCECK